MIRERWLVYDPSLKLHIPMWRGATKDKEAKHGKDKRKRPHNKVDLEGFPGGIRGNRIALTIDDE